MLIRLLIAIVSALVVLVFCLPTVLAQERWAETAKAAKAAYNEAKFAQAEKLYQQALECAETFGEGDIRLTASLRNLATCLMGQTNKSDEIVRLLLREQKIMSSLGEDFPGRLDGMVLLGRAYYHANKNEEAEKCFARALSLCGPVSSGRASNVDWREIILPMLGKCYMAQGKYNEAEVFLKRALAILDGQGRRDQSTFYVCRDLGETCYQLHRYDESEAYLKRCLQVSDLDLGTNTAVKTAVYTRLGENYHAQGKSEEALRYLGMAVALGGSKNDYVMESLFPHIAQIELAQGHYRQCLAAASKALKMAEGKYPVLAAEIRAFQATVPHSHDLVPGIR